MKYNMSLKCGNDERGKIKNERTEKYTAIHFIIYWLIYKKCDILVASNKKEEKICQYTAMPILVI